MTPLAHVAPFLIQSSLPNIFRLIRRLFSWINCCNDNGDETPMVWSSVVPSNAVQSCDEANCCWRALPWTRQAHHNFDSPSNLDLGPIRYPGAQPTNQISILRSTAEVSCVPWQSRRRRRLLQAVSSGASSLKADRSRRILTAMAKSFRHIELAKPTMTAGMKVRGPFVCCCCCFHPSSAFVRDDSIIFATLDRAFFAHADTYYITKISETTTNERFV